MNELRRQIAQARRRMLLDEFLARSPLCLFVALMLSAAAIALPRVISIANLPQRWDSMWLIGGLAMGIIAAAVWTLISHHTDLDAAIEIDCRFDLRERIASSLQLTAAELETEAGQALVKDAIRTASRIDVSDKFRIRLYRRAWLPLVPAGIAFLLMTLANSPAATSSSDADSPAAVSKQIKNAAESARKKLEEQRKRAEQEGLKSAEGLFKQIEMGARALAEKNDLDRTKAAVKLNELAKQLEQRRRQLGGKSGLQKHLQNLKSLGSGPADNLAQAMKQGDFKKAAEETGTLARSLEDKQLDANAQRELAKQLEQIRDKLASAADAHQQAIDELQQQMDKQRQQGDLANAGDLQNKLDQLAQQMPQMKQLGQLANQMGQVQQALQQGEAQQSAEALRQTAQQFAEMQQQSNELQMLDAATNELQMAKSAMACQQCQGKGCALCQGGLAANDDDSTSGKPGSGIGTGSGNGSPSNDAPKSTPREIQVRQRPGQGAAVYAGTVDGANIKGQVEASIQQEVSSLGGRPADPLTAEQLPRNRREHAEQYFNRLRDGK